jgi:hypothetical protein
MNDQRQGAIAGLVLQLHETRDKLQSGSKGCGFECSSIMYGALAMQMDWTLCCRQGLQLLSRI